MVTNLIYLFIYIFLHYSSFHTLYEMMSSVLWHGSNLVNFDHLLTQTAVCKSSHMLLSKLGQRVKWIISETSMLSTTVLSICHLVSSLMQNDIWRIKPEKPENAAGVPIDPSNASFHLWPFGITRVICTP